MQCSELVFLSDGQYILRFFPYTFQLLKRGGVQRKTSYTHVLTRTSYCKEISACAFFGRVNILSTMLHIPKPTSLGFCTLVHSYYAACMLTQFATVPRVCTLVLSLIRQRSSVYSSRSVLARLHTQRQHIEGSGIYPMFTDTRHLPNIYRHVNIPDSPRHSSLAFFHVHV